MKKLNYPTGKFKSFALSNAFFWKQALSLSLCLSSTLLFSQIYLSEKWKGTAGAAATFNHNVTKTDNLGFVYFAGATLNASNNRDIILQKFSADGELIWQKTYNGQANMDDMAADVFIDDDYNVYVTGASIEDVANNYDLIVLKYDSGGDSLWKYVYNYDSTLIAYDAGTSITGDNAGNIYVTGGSVDSTSLSDYVTLSLDANNGSENWVRRYDYIGLSDVPNKILFDGNKVIVSGASQIPGVNERWEIATVSYRDSDGLQLSVVRSNGNATSGVNEVFDAVVDDNGFVYVTGAVLNENTGFDIAVYKLNPQLNIEWEQHFDGYEGEDKGKGIKVDAEGNVFVAGYTSTQNSGKNYILLKYDKDGNLLYDREFNGEANLDDEAVQLVIDNEDRVFVVGHVSTATSTDIQIVGYDTAGEIFAQNVFNGAASLSDKPMDMAIDLAGDIIVVGMTEVSPGNFDNITIKYVLNEKPFVPVFVDDEPSHNKNEMTISFNRDVVKLSAIDNISFNSGALSDFIEEEAIDAMSDKLGFDCSILRTYKVFRKLTSADTLSISRLGDTVRLYDFWAVLSVYLPSEIVLDEDEIIDTLNTMNDIISFAEKNYIGQFDNSPDDPIYSFSYPTGQTGLYDPFHGINVENVWAERAGQNFVKVGVFDSGINWRHEDFGDGTWDGSNITGGWNFYNHVHPSQQLIPDPYGHGTAVAGIIGAIRNNGKGVAGIAGEDKLVANSGCQLFSMAIPTYQEIHPFHFFPLVIIPTVEAIVDGAISTNTGKGYGLHIQSHSWGNSQNSQLLRESIRTCNINNCIVSVSSGNTEQSTLRYPASYNDSWVMKVGANNVSGSRAGFSTYGNNLDFIAPGTPDIYKTLDHNSISGYSYNQLGTSIAVPHVSGVAALMCSEHHPMTNSEYPNVLAPEDVEIMLESFATDMGDPGYDVYNGHGRINAEETFNRIRLPYRIRHYQHTVNTSSAVLYASNQSVGYPEGVQGLPSGFYIYSTDVYKLDVTLNHNIPSTETYLHGWVRNSASDLYGLTASILNPHWSGVTMNSFNQNNASFTGYIYNLKIYNVNTGQFEPERWFPADLNSNVKFAYSIYTIDDDPSVGVKKDVEKSLKIDVFPNPAYNELNFKFQVDNESIEVDVYDLTGRQVNSYMFRGVGGGVQNESIDISEYKNGLYLCRFTVGDKYVTRKFMKK